MNNTGYLALYIGPMFSGKTSRLLEIYKTKRFCKQEPLVINFSGDNRYNNFETHLSTHDERQVPCIRANKLQDILDINDIFNITEACYKINKKLDTINAVTIHDWDTISDKKLHIFLSLTDKKYKHYTDTILINEGQFFPDLLPWVIHMVNKLNKHVYVAGLDGDFEQNPIGQMLQLIPHSNSCTKLTSLCYDCKDGTEAIFSHRISNETTQVVIGTDNYIPLCRKCYKNKMNLKNVSSDEYSSNS